MIGTTDAEKTAWKGRTETYRQCFCNGFRGLDDPVRAACIFLLAGSIHNASMVSPIYVRDKISIFMKCLLS